MHACMQIRMMCKSQLNRVPIMLKWSLHAASQHACGPNYLESITVHESCRRRILSRPATSFTCKAWVYTFQWTMYKCCMVPISYTGFLILSPSRTNINYLYLRSNDGIRTYVGSVADLIDHHRYASVKKTSYIQQIPYFTYIQNDSLR